MAVSFPKAKSTNAGNHSITTTYSTGRSRMQCLGFGNRCSSPQSRQNLFHEDSSHTTFPYNETTLKEALIGGTTYNYQHDKIFITLWFALGVKRHTGGDVVPSTFSVNGARAMRRQSLALLQPINQGIPACKNFQPVHLDVRKPVSDMTQES